MITLLKNIIFSILRINSEYLKLLRLKISKIVKLGSNNIIYKIVNIFKMSDSENIHILKGIACLIKILK